MMAWAYFENIQRQHTKEGSEHKTKSKFPTRLNSWSEQQEGRRDTDRACGGEAWSVWRLEPDMCDNDDRAGHNSLRPHLPVSCNHLITQNGPQDCLHLEAGLHQATGRSNHTGCQGPADSYSAEVLEDVGRQSERHRAVGIQVTCIAHIGTHAAFNLIIPAHEPITILNHLFDFYTITGVGTFGYSLPRQWVYWA